MLDEIHCGDCLDKLKELEDNSIDAVVTDPPYGLSFMGKKWDYDVPSQEIWEECLRVLKPGGYLLAFAGTRTQHRMAVRIEDAGFEIRDMIAWVYGSGFPKSLNIGKAVDKLQGNVREDMGRNPAWRKGNGDGATTSTGWAKPQRPNKDKGTSEWEGWGTALKPALEPITVARKPLSEKTVAENVLKWGTGGINIDGCRVGTEKVESGRKNRSHEQDWGMKPNDGGITTGRFPANLTHDGSDEVVELFPETGKSGTGKKYKKDYDKTNSWKNTSKEIDVTSFGDSGSAARFFYCAKASKSERNKGCEELEAKANSGSYQFREDGSLDGKPTAPKSNFHPTVKPIALMEYLVKLVSREGAVVLDPFAGSGSTLIACKNLGRKYIGIERELEYCEIARKRIERKQQTLL